MSPVIFRWRNLSLLTLLLSLLVPLTAAAHGEAGCGNNYACEIGWLNEPVIVGEQNGLELFIAAKDDPEAGIANITTLQFTVKYGGQSQSYPLVPAEEKPGAYSAVFIPMREGQYTFHLTGTINGEAIEAEFEPEEVVTAGTLAFPAGQPSLTELQSQLAATQAQARATQTLSIVGLILGLTGTGVGVLALTRKK